MDKVKRILMPTDFSQGAQQALRYAVVLANELEAGLHLLHVVTGPDSGGEAPGVSAEMEKLRADLCADAARYRRGLPAARQDGDAPLRCTVLRHAEAARAILEYADSRHIDLVVIAPYGHRQGGRFVTGSTAEKVMRLASCDVLTTGLSGVYKPDVLQRILVPVDFSPPSALALERAKVLAKQGRAHLTVLHGVETTVFPAKRPGVVTVKARTSHEEAHAKLERFYQRTKGPEVPHRFCVRRGRPADLIATFANHENIHLVVQGTRGRSGIDYAIHGSVAQIIVRQAPCPVLTVKMPERASAPDTKKNAGRGKRGAFMPANAMLANNPKTEVAL